MSIKKIIALIKKAKQGPHFEQEVTKIIEATS